MQSVETAQFVGECEIRGGFNQVLINFDDVHRAPFLVNASGRRLPRDESYRADRLQIPDTTTEPIVGVIHRVEHEVATGLGYVTLDQRARIEIQDQ